MYKKKNILSIISLILSALALIVSVISLVVRPTGPDQSYENPALEQQVQALQAQVDALSAHQTAPVEELPGLSDWNLAAKAWPDGSGADVTLTVVPNLAAADAQLIFRVMLEDQEVASDTCAFVDGVLCASVSLPTADGYGYYCEIVSHKGSQQLPLSTPNHPTDEPLIYLESSLNAYGVLTVEDWAEAKGTLTIVSGHVEVQLPLIGADGEVIVEKAELVLLLDGEEVSRQDIGSLPAAEDGRVELPVVDLQFSVPDMEESSFLELTLEITLTGSQTITAPGCGWYPGDDGLSMIVG